MSRRIAPSIATSDRLNVNQRTAPEPGVDEVDDVAEPQPVGEVADRPAEEQAQRDRDEEAGPGPRLVPDDEPDDDQADDPEHDRRPLEEAEQRALVVGHRDPHDVAEDRDRARRPGRTPRPRP